MTTAGPFPVWTLEWSYGMERKRECQRDMAITKKTKQTNEQQDDENCLMAKENKERDLNPTKLVKSTSSTNSSEELVTSISSRSEISIKTDKNR